MKREESAVHLYYPRHPHDDYLAANNHYLISKDLVSINF